MATQQIALMFLLIAANCQRTQAQALDANENAPYFSELCRMIQLATTKMPTMEPLPDLSGFSAAAELVNLSYTAPAALSQLAEKTKAEENIGTDGTAANNYCKQGKTATCKKLADLLTNDQTANQAKTFLTRLKDKKISPDILALAAEVSKAVVDIAELKPDTDLATALKNTNAALESKETGEATAEDLKGSASRVTDCGKAETGNEEPGTDAGKSLAHDALCMCGTSGTANQKDACGFDIQAGTAIIGNWATAGTQAKQWHNLKKACRQQNTAAVLTSSQLRAAVNNYINDLTTAKLTTKHFPGAIGYTEAAQTTGCDGEKSDNNGACVFYGKPAGGTLTTKIAWAKKLLSAADNIDDAIKARQEQLHLLNHVKALNATLTALVLMPKTTAKTEPPGSGASTETQKAKAMEEKKKECATHKDNKTTCENAGKCKRKGGENDKGGCEVDETKVTTEGNAAGTDGGAAGTTKKIQREIRNRLFQGY